jgi:hypothetical protein
VHPRHGQNPCVPQTVLSRRALNRALLVRQLLLERAPLPAATAIHHLVGLQAQQPLSPYVGLWSRLADFQPSELARLINERKVVRIALMRSTIHSVTAEDCLALRPLVQPVLERGHQGAFARHLDGLDLEKIGAAGRALVEQQPRTGNELGRLLAERWPGRDRLALANAVRAFVPLVQPPPRGIWGQGGQARLTSAEHWLGRPLAAMPVEEMILRYLGAFGPASVRDVQAWSGLTRLGAAVEGLRPRLVTFRDENGVELFDLPDAPRPDPDTPAPPRFLPEYDNALLSHTDRTRIVTPDQGRRIFTRGALLVDGFVRGAWRVKDGELELELFEPLSKKDAAAVEDESERLVEFAIRPA